MVYLLSVVVGKGRKNIEDFRIFGEKDPLRRPLSAVGFRDVFLQIRKGLDETNAPRAVAPVLRNLSFVDLKRPEFFRFSSRKTKLAPRAVSLPYSHRTTILRILERTRRRRRACTFG
ncbi:hypothetical protein TNCT_483261 [Trichonephila clavata]|uniref:Uncharacterized protein n=1 Tax=Trichonephila clavata TaxID=2740835 RepID=A0A8X6F0U9_TRICU|nr:hypothetical protein TNCT_483261 [Trichonephila clavata]